MQQSFVIDNIILAGGKSNTLKSIRRYLKYGQLSRKLKFDRHTPDDETHGGSNVFSSSL